MNDRRHHVDRVLGMLARTAVGDGLGAPFEGRPAVSATALHRWAVSSRTLRHTDDTAMTLVLAEHLARTGGVDRRALASEFAAAWSAEPHRGYGRGAGRVLAAIEAGTPSQRAAASVFPGGSWGDGAAMRAAPVAVVAPGVHEAAELARSSAEPTHAHEHGGHGAARQDREHRHGRGQGGERGQPLTGGHVVPQRQLHRTHRGDPGPDRGEQQQDSGRGGHGEGRPGLRDDPVDHRTCERSRGRASAMSTTVTTTARDSRRQVIWMTQPAISPTGSPAKLGLG